MNAQLKAGYAGAKAVTREHARTFYLASFLLWGKRRRAAFALYALCRRLDDLVDDGAAAQGDEGARPLPWRLSHARAVIGTLYDGLPDLAAPHLRGGATPTEGAPAVWPDEELAAYRDTIARFRIPEAPFQELVSGMEMDLTQPIYETYSELDLYCHRVAGVVGLMMAPVLGCSDPRALQAAAELGKAMQLTNILRDVREDLDRGRVYLPKDELAAFGLDVHDLRRGAVDDRWIAFMRCQVARARSLYRRGAAGIRALRAFGAQRMVVLMSAAYGDILRAIEQRGYDVFKARAVVEGRRKAQLLATALVHPGALVPPPADTEPAPVPVLPSGAWS